MSGAHRGAASHSPRRLTAIVGSLAVVASTAWIVGVPQAIAATGPVSDDFSGSSLSSMWSVSDPVGDGSVSLVGTGTADARLSLAVPAGPSHDAWMSDQSLGVQQSVADADFAVEAKFDSVPSKKYQDEGVLVRQDASNWVRFSLYSDGSQLFAFGASTVSDSSSKRLKVGVGAGSSLWLRVARSGSTWSMSYSADGSSWQSIGSFSQSLAVSSVGVYAGDSPPSGSSTAPGFTALVDYFFNQASPISPEDPAGGGGSGGGDTTPPVISGVSAVAGASSATVSWSTNEATTGKVDYGTSTSYGASAADSTSGTSHSVTLSGLATGATYHYAVTATDTAGNTASSADATVTTSSGSGGGSGTGAGPVSDDFSGSSLNSMWSVSNPVGDGAVSLVGTGTSDARLSLAVPAGASHDAWMSDKSLGVQQSVADADFAVEAKFDSVPSKRFQDEGVMVRQDSGTWARFSLYNDGSRLYAFAASTTSGSSSQRLKVAVGAGSSLWLRVARAGSGWSMSYSADGSSWQSIGSFSQSLAVSSVGVYAGDAPPSGSSSAPGFTALVDYFFNQASPISPEDPVGSGSGGGSGGDTTPPVISGVSAVAGASSATVNWSTNEATTGKVDYGTTATYGHTVSDTASSTSHNVTLPSLTAGSTYHYAITATDAVGNSAHTADATFTTSSSGGAGSGPTITVWYGTHQVFGTYGQPQTFANILGNVADPDGVQSLSYTLDGGSAHALSVGPDKRRLQSPGDFNADIPWSSLSVGDNAVVLRAVDAKGNASTANVTVSLVAGTPKALPFTQTWSSSTPLNQQAQVVDGLWTVDSKGLHIVQPGYDRLVDIGSLALKDFVVSVPVTVYGFGPGANVYPSNEPLVGFGLRWQGHTKADSSQPEWGWYPTGAFAWFRWYSPTKIEMRGNNDTPTVKTNASMTLGTTYIMKAQAKTQTDGSTLYSFKMWPSSGSEPSAWNEQITVTGGPSTGSILLIAHQVDAAFGSVTVAAAP